MINWEFWRIDWMVQQLTEEATQAVRDGRVPGDLVEGEGPLVSVHGYSGLIGPADAQLITRLSAEIARLGSEGWELVSHTLTNLPPAQVFLFKRPIE